MPYKISSKDYSMYLADREVLNKLRRWAADYFKSDFTYENSMHLTLAKARDIISNELIGGGQSKLSQTGFDLVVKVESVIEGEYLDNGDQKVTLKISDLSCG